MMLLLLGQLLLLNKMVVVDLKDYSWHAYENSIEVKSGRAVGGRRRCPENKVKRCRTPQGVFKVLKKSGRFKRSDIYPLDCNNKKKCGAKMPYYMKLRHDGVGIHGSKFLKGHLSHGCIRVSPKDAKWLNEFVNIGTQVVINKY